LEIKEWTDELHAEQVTAICPHCSIDSVIGSASGHPISEEFLVALKEQWFKCEPRSGLADSSEWDLDRELLDRLQKCQSLNSQISERLDRMAEGLQSETTNSVAVWSLDKLEADAQELAKQFRIIALLLRVS